MKLLRETIRKLLLENNDHYEKITELLCTGDLASIKQAIELAEALDYAHRVEYKSSTERKGFRIKDTKLVHRWTFSVVRPLEAAIMNQWGKRSIL
jgi:hypothetical protein